MNDASDRQMKQEPVMAEEILDVVDVEDFGKKNEKPPKAKTYRIRIDKQKYDVSVPQMTGRQLLEDVAKKTPAERYLLSQRLHGGAVQKIGLDQLVDFTAPGVERFMTLPLNETEG